MNAFRPSVSAETAARASAVLPPPRPERTAARGRAGGTTCLNTTCLTHVFFKSGE